MWLLRCEQQALAEQVEPGTAISGSFKQLRRLITRSGIELQCRADHTKRGRTLEVSRRSFRTSGQMEGGMAHKRSTPEEIVGKLRQVEVLVSQGKPVAEAIRAIGVREPTYYWWRLNTAV